MAEDVTINAAMDALVATLAADHRETGTFDLSGAGQVVRGKHSRPWQDGVSVCLERGDCRRSNTSDEMGPIPLGTYGMELEVLARGWAPVTDAEQRTADEISAKLSSDLVRAIEEDTTLGGTIYQSLAELGPPTGVSSLAGGGQLAGCLVHLRLRWRSVTGV